MASILGTGLDSAQRAKQQYNVNREKTEGEGKPERAGGTPPPTANTDVYAPSAAAMAMSILVEETEETESAEVVAEEETLFDYMDSDMPVDEELAELDEFLASIDETVMDEVDGDEVDVDGDDIEVDGDEVDVDGDDIEVDGDEVDVDGDDIEVDGDDIEVDGDEVDVDGDDIEVDGDEVDVDGDEADVDTEDAETPTVVVDNENRVHGFVSSITDADLTAMSYAMQALQMTSFGMSADSIYGQMDETSANKISEWFSDSSGSNEEMDDLLSALENLFPGSTSETEDEDVEVDSDVIDPVEDSEELEEVEPDSDVIDPVEDTEIQED